MRADADAGGHPARRSVQRRGVAWPEIEVIDASDAETMLAQRVPHDGISSVRIEGMIRALGLVLGDVTVGKDAVLDAQLCCFPAVVLLPRGTASCGRRLFDSDRFVHGVNTTAALGVVRCTYSSEYATCRSASRYQQVWICSQVHVTDCRARNYRVDEEKLREAQAVPLSETCGWIHRYD